MGILFRFSLFFGVLILVVILFLSIFAMRTNDDKIKLAEDNYNQGVSAKTIYDRKVAFNSALNMFLELELDYHPEFGDGRLYFDIGNTYFQLEEYPLAIYYYSKAEKLMPRDERVQHNLTIARDKLSIAKPSSNDFMQFFFLSSFISLPERLQIFFLASIIAIFLCSRWLWTRKRFYRNSAILALSVVAIAILNVGITRYFSPVHAVLIHASELRRDAGTAFAKVGDLPIYAGTTVEVLETAKDAHWLKIVAPNGDFGFIPQESARIL